MGIGDPACDVMVAGKLHSSAAQDAFCEASSVDDATWARARGCVLSQAVAALADYTPQNNPSLYREAEAWLELMLSESEECDPGRREGPPELRCESELMPPSQRRMHPRVQRVAPHNRDSPVVRSQTWRFGFRCRTSGRSNVEASSYRITT